MSICRSTHKYPLKVSGYQLTHNVWGGLVSITTPLGYKHKFHSIPLLGQTLIKYSPPWAHKNSFSFCLNEAREIVHTILPNLTHFSTDKSQDFVEISKNFTTENSPKASLIRKGEFMLLTERENLRISSKTLILKGKIIHHQSFSYTNGYLGKHSIDSYHNLHEYDDNFRLKSFNSNDFSMKLTYDKNGNVEKMDYGNGLETIFEHEFGERIKKIGKNPILYDANGNLIEKPKFQFHYDSKARLEKLKMDEKNHTFQYGNNSLIFDYLTRFYYDSDGKIAKIIDQNETWTVLYDEDDHIFGMENQNGSHLWIASDLNGTPLQVFEHNGKSIVKVQRNPLGND